MLKKTLTIITLCSTIILNASIGVTGGAIDVTSLYDIVYEYDKLNRVTKATYASGESIGYSYDAGGNLLGVVFDNPSEVEDSDGDGISDEREIELHLNPNSNDSDGDGILDGEEIGDVDNPRNTDGTDEIDALDTDSDNDGMPDAFEYQNDLNYIDATDANVDSDGDGYTNLEEYTAGTNPQEIDSSPNPRPWDFNNDNIVDYLDLGLLADHWLENENDPNWNPVLNLDTTAESGVQVINYLDLGVLADHWLE